MYKHGIDESKKIIDPWVDTFMNEYDSDNAFEVEALAKQNAHWTWQTEFVTMSITGVSLRWLYGFDRCMIVRWHAAPTG